MHGHHAIAAAALEHAEVFDTWRSSWDLRPAGVAGQGHSRSGLIFRAERGLVSGRSIGHAEVDFMSLSNSQGSRCDSSLERAFLRCI
jgi:hypothetical protein